MKNAGRGLIAKIQKLKKSVPRITVEEAVLQIFDGTMADEWQKAAYKNMDVSLNLPEIDRPVYKRYTASELNLFEVQKRFIAEGIYIKQGDEGLEIFANPSIVEAPYTEKVYHS